MQIIIIYYCTFTSALFDLTDDKVPGRGEYQGAGECDSVQGYAGWSGPHTAVVEQPNEATAQAEVDRPAVRNDTIMALERQGKDVMYKWFIKKTLGFPTVVQFDSVLRNTVNILITEKFPRWKINANTVTFIQIYISLLLPTPKNMHPLVTL